VWQEFVDRGLVDPALDHLVKLAGSDDPTIREDALAAIGELGLDLLLPDAKPEAPGES
jgi:hypothetical protein